LNARIGNERDFILDDGTPHIPIDIGSYRGNNAIPFLMFFLIKIPNPPKNLLLFDFSLTKRVIKETFNINI
jgi:hypothetical protein